MAPGPTASPPPTQWPGELVCVVAGQSAAQLGNQRRRAPMFLPEVLSTSLERPPSSLTSDNLLWLKTTKQMFADLSLREKAFLGMMLAMFPQLSHGKAGK